MSKAVSQSIGPKIYSHKVYGVLRNIIVCAIGFFIARGMVEGFSPMLVAYYCAVYENKKIRLWGFLSIILGIATVHSATNLMKYVFILIGITVVVTISEFFSMKTKLLNVAVIGTTCTLVIGIIFGFYFESHPLFIMNAVMESFVVFFLALLFKRGINYITKKPELETISRETFISLGLLIAIAFMGITGFKVIEISIIELIGINAILLIGYKYGLEASSIMGISIALATMYSGGDGSVHSFVIWSILGIVAGLFRELGKIGTLVAYALVFILLSLVYYPGRPAIEIAEILIITSSIFMIIPIKKSKTIQQSQSIDRSDSDEIIEYKLKKFSDTYENIANMFTNQFDLQQGLSSNEINQLMDDVANKVCKDCSMCNMCWEKGFYDTYQTVYSVLSAIEKRGKVVTTDIPHEFYDKCINPEQFIITVNRLFELYKTNLKWEHKVMENKELFAQQFSNLSKIIKDLSDNIAQGNQYKKELLIKIERELNKTKVPYENVKINNFNNDKNEIIITSQNMELKRELLKRINKAGSKRYQLKKESYSDDMTIKQYIFTEKEKYRLVKGVAKLNKDNQEVSGDNFSFISMESGKDVIALSDGMGSGEKAFLESKAAIEMLEQLVEGGFEINMAIKTVNSILGIRNDSQAFATLDIGMIDRFTGDCEFIKNGAVSTFLKRGDLVEIIKTDTLPLGMFKDVDCRVIKKKLRADDIVVMLSDGIVDTEVDKINKERWLEDIIAQFENYNPQFIADSILDVAREKNGGIAKDDMTVIVFRVWEKVG